MVATWNTIDHLCIPCTKLECTICQVLHFYYFILSKIFKLGWKMYKIDCFSKMRLQVGVKDVMKLGSQFEYRKTFPCSKLQWTKSSTFIIYYFILAKNFKLGWKMYQIWASMIIYQLNRGKIRNSVIGPNCNWGCLCFSPIGQ